MPPDLIAALSPPAAPPGSTALPGGATALPGNPTAALFASLLAATAPPALTVSPAAASPAAVTGPPMHTTTILSKISFSPVSVSPGTDPTEPVAPMPKKPVLWETEQPAAAPAPLLLPVSLTALDAKPELPGVTAKDAEPEAAKDAKKDTKKDSLKEPVDTAPALVPNGELFLPPPPPVMAAISALHSATPAPVPSAVASSTAISAVPETVETPAAVPAARPIPEAAPAPSAQITPLTQAAPLTQTAPLTQAAPVAWTPPTDAPVAPVPSASPVVTNAVANAVTSAILSAAPPTGVGDGLLPALPARADKNSALKTPQKDLKMAGPRADTYTRTQTELPRLTHLTRKDTPTEETSTEESRTAAGGTQGQGPAPTLTFASALQTRPAAAAPDAPALTHTERLAVVQQLAEGAGGIRLSAPGAAQEMTVQLHPKDWGSLHVTVQIAPAVQSAGDAPTADAPKKVTAQIVAETPQIKAALESHSGGLHQKLREAGLHLDSVTVTVRAPEAAHSSSGTTPQGSQNDTQGRFQDGTQHSLNGGTQGSTQSQGGTQGSEFGQRLTDFTGRQDGSTDSSAGPALSGGGTTGSQNGSQGGRQGSQTPHETLRWMGTEPEADAAPRWTASRHSGAVRLDLRA